MALESSWTSRIARAALILSFVSVIALSVVGALSVPRDTGGPLAPAGTAAGSNADGVGMTDVESPGVSQVIGGAAGGLPEPTEFSRPDPLYYTAYKVQKGDMIGDLAAQFGLNQDTILSFNNIKNSRLLQIGQYLKIPNQDGLLYTVGKKDSLSAIAENYQMDTKTIEAVNGPKADAIEVGMKLFIPGARMDSTDLREINGDLFIWPVRGWITSPYGYRISPFTGARQFHAGLDIGSPMGTPIKAAMSGRVSATGYDINTGNYVLINHHSGYQTLYGHLSVIGVKPGAYVRTGQTIGKVGSTGLSTGSHLHFTVFKNHVTVNPRPLMK